MTYFWQFKVERWVCKKLAYREFDVLSPYQAPGLAVYEDDSLKDDKPGAGTVLRATSMQNFWLLAQQDQVSKGPSAVHSIL